MPHNPHYRGRFAPSPTGRLHMGSLVAAIASYLDARAAQGDWFIRIEDIDPLREEKGAADAILRSLENHGLDWDSSVRYQSARRERYEAIIADLQQQDLAYLCPCSRRYLIEHQGQHHPQECAPQKPSTHPHTYALRFRCPSADFQWHDVFLQHCQFTLNATTDDFILKRKEGFYAYQLAVVIDDYDDQISHIIRGQDLLDSTPCQLALLNALDWPAPQYGHIPLVMGNNGQKLSKQNKAPELDNRKASANIYYAMQFLGLPVEPSMATEPPASQLAWATHYWSHIKSSGRPSPPGV